MYGARTQSIEIITLPIVYIIIKGFGPVNSEMVLLIYAMLIQPISSTKIKKIAVESEILYIVFSAIIDTDIIRDPIVTAKPLARKKFLICLSLLSILAINIKLNFLDDFFE